jgi:NADH:ubiquinone oxidoreductase subunit 5 (subunit L)/multisubunit Na+/H+ antiporter MnhA subunit
LTAAAGLASSLSLLLKFNDFLGSSLAVAFESGANAKLGHTHAALSLYVDATSYSFGLLTALIGSAVYFYAFSYMRFEKNILNFLVYLEVFKLSMILLV